MERHSSLRFRSLLLIVALLICCTPGVVEGSTRSHRYRRRGQVSVRGVPNNGGGKKNGKEKGNEESSIDTGTLPPTAYQTPLPTVMPTKGVTPPPSQPPTKAPTTQTPTEAPSSLPTAVGDRVTNGGDGDNQIGDPSLSPTSQDAGIVGLEDESGGQTNRGIPVGDESTGLSAGGIIGIVAAGVVVVGGAVIAGGKFQDARELTA